MRTKLFEVDRKIILNTHGFIISLSASAPCGWAHSLPTYANGYKQAVLKTDEPKGLWVRILPLAFWTRQVLQNGRPLVDGYTPINNLITEGTHENR